MAISEAPDKFHTIVQLVENLENLYIHFNNKSITLINAFSPNFTKISCYCISLIR